MKIAELFPLMMYPSSKNSKYGLLIIFRINLEFLQNPEEAVKIVRDVQSVEGAKMVAK